MLIKSRILLAAASLLALVACGSNDPATGKEAVAATVNGTPISENLVGMMVKQRTELGRPATAEVRNTYIDRLAMMSLASASFSTRMWRAEYSVPAICDLIFSYSALSVSSLTGLFLR